MAKYNKGLKTIKVHTRGGETITATDAIDHSIASRALTEFLGHNVMHIYDDPKDYVPFHAVDYIEVTTAVGSFDREDPYCKGGIIIREIWSGENQGTTADGKTTYTLTGANFPSTAKVGDTICLTFGEEKVSKTVVVANASVVEAGTNDNLPYVVVNSDGTATVVTDDADNAPTLTEVSLIHVDDASLVCGATVCDAKIQC